MLRERKASIADRSLSSLTGELLLLATAAAAFATFAARRLGGEEYPRQRARGTGQGWRYGGSEGHHEGGSGLGVWGEECGLNVYQEAAGVITRAPEQCEQVMWSNMPRTGGGGRVQRTWPQRSKGRRHMRGGGIRSNVGRIQGDTTTPQNHNHNAAPNGRRQRREGGRQGGGVK